MMKALFLMKQLYPYQTHCPQMRTFALNDRYMKYLLQRVCYVMKFTLTHHSNHSIHGVTSWPTDQTVCHVLCTGGDNSTKGCFERKAKFLRESGVFAGNREAREIFWERRKYSGTLQEKIGPWNTTFILLGKLTSNHGLKTASRFN